MKQYIFTIIMTAAITMCLAWAVWKISVRFKIYPGIRERDVHKTPTPRLGGVAIFIGIAVMLGVSAANPFFSVVWEQPEVVWSVLAASLVIVIVGVLDDLMDLDWMIKLGAQFLAAGIVAIGGGLQIYALPIGGVTIGSGWLSITLTMLAIVTVMNAVNFIDGLDGLVAGVALIANSVFFVYSYLVVRDSGASTYFNLASLIAALLVGACAGFLVLNWRPAKIFMGDSGALLIGLLMAVSAVAITGNPAVFQADDLGRSQLLGAFVPILLPIVIVFIPLADFGLAVIRRTAAGKSPFAPDRKHLHHRMLDLGHSDLAAVIIFYAWSFIISFTVLLMYIFMRADSYGNYQVALIYGGVGILACIVVTLVPSRPHAPAAVRRPTP